MVPREPDVNFVPGQIGGVAFECRYVLPQRLAKENPTCMRPPLAIARRVRIAFLVRELVMLTMYGHPEQRAPLQCRYAAKRKKILEPLGCRKGAMDEQPVITDAESQAHGHT